MNRKIVKIISAFTSSLIILTVTQSGAFAIERASTVRNESDGTILFEDNFSSYSSIGDLNSNWTLEGDTSACSIVNGALNVVYNNGSGNEDSNTPKIATNIQDPVTAGDVRISFDLIIPSSSSNYDTGLRLSGTGGDPLYVFRIVHNAQGVPYVQMYDDNAPSANSSMNINEPSNWHNLSVDTPYQFVIDMNIRGNDQTFYMAIYNKTTNALVAEFYKKTYFSAWTFQNICFFSWKTGSTPIDNVKIQKINLGLPISDNFDSYSTVHSASAVRDWNVAASNAGFTTIDSAHGLTAYTSSNAAPIFGPHRMENVITTGVVDISFDTFIANDTRALRNRLCIVPSVVVDGSNWGSHQIVQIWKDENEETAELTNSGDRGSGIALTLGKWYTVKTKLNFSERIYTIKVYDDGMDLIGTINDVLSESNGAYSSINFTTWKAGTFYFDNVKVSIGSATSADIISTTAVTAKSMAPVHPTDVATGFFTTVKNVGETSGSFSRLTYDITSGGEKHTFTGQAGAAITLAPGAKAYMGLIIKYLYDSDAWCSVVIE